jgi:hypothetical protein
MPRHPVRTGSLSSLTLGAALALSLLAAGRSAADTASPQAFHLNEIDKILVGYNGDMTIQAVEIKMITSGENFVSGMSIAVYDSTGTLVANLGTFGSSVPNGAAGDRILCATEGFQEAFSITPDLLIDPGLPMVTGQVSFETPGCRVNSVAYGNVPVPLTGTTSATPLPPHGATALVRIADSPTVPTCPLAENSAARFQLRGAGASNPHVFRNNARDTAQVWTSITSVEPEPAPPRAASLRASPNPFAASTTIRLPDHATRVLVYDVSGRVVRTWSVSPGASAGTAADLTWDGRDAAGRHSPSGLYLVEVTTEAGPVRGSVILLR